MYICLFFVSEIKDIGDFDSYFPMDTLEDGFLADINRPLLKACIVKNQTKSIHGVTNNATCFIHGTVNNLQIQSPCEAECFVSMWIRHHCHGLKDTLILKTSKFEIRCSSNVSLEQYKMGLVIVKIITNICNYTISAPSGFWYFLSIAFSYTGDFRININNQYVNATSKKCHKNITINENVTGMEVGDADVCIDELLIDSSFNFSEKTNALYNLYKYGTCYYVFTQPQKNVPKHCSM